MNCTYLSNGDFQKRYTRLASYQCFLDTLRDGSEDDTEAILHRLRQPVSLLEDQSIDDRLETIETILQRLRDVPQNEAADLVKRIRTGKDNWTDRVQSTSYAMARARTSDCGHVCVWSSCRFQ